MNLAMFLSMAGICRKGNVATFFRFAKSVFPGICTLEIPVLQCWVILRKTKMLDLILEFLPMLVPVLLLLEWMRKDKIGAVSKGDLGERRVRRIAKSRLPPEIYRPLHNLTLPTLDGTTQIDHVFVSRFGIFVLETKNLTGWIFGGERDAQWTQKIYRRSTRFQNPLRQNFKHVKAVERVLQVPPGTVRSVVAFVGSSTFKTEMPPDVTQGAGFVDHIKSFRETLFSEEQVSQIVERLEAECLEPTLATHRKHVRFLKQRSDPNAERHCPKCGSRMVLRTTKNGAKAGRQFWGCSRFPACRVMLDFG